jgi:hypothetical protein
MSEIAVDSVVESGQTDSGPSERSTESPSRSDMPEMGLGMLEVDSPSSDPEPSTEQTSDDSTQRATDTRSTKQTNNDNLSEFERGRREADRYFQQHNERLLSERRAFEAERAKWEAERQQAPKQDLQSEVFGDANTLRERAMEVSDPQQQRALMEQAAGIEYVNRLVEEQFQQRLKEMGLENYQQERQMVQALLQQQEQQRQGELLSQIEEAKSVLGEQTLTDPLTLQFITNNRGMLDMQNPDTGKKFTLTELVSRWTGRQAQDADRARREQRTQRNVAKMSAVSRGNGASVRDTGGGPISRAEAVAEIGQTM